MESAAIPIPWENIPIFAGLKPDALEFICSKAQTLCVEEGEFIVRQGETGNKMFVIRSGSVRVWKEKSENREFEFARLKTGDFFGEMCILETLPRAANVQGIEKVKLASLSTMAFYELYRSRPDQYAIMILNIARDLSRRLRRLEDAQ